MKILKENQDFILKSYESVTDSTIKTTDGRQNPFKRVNPKFKSQIKILAYIRLPSALSGF